MSYITAVERTYTYYINIHTACIDHVIHLSSWQQDPGKLRLQEDGVHFKSSKTGKTLLVRHVDITGVEWLRVAKGFEMKLVTVDGQIRKFDGFRESVSVARERPL